MTALPPQFLGPPIAHRGLHDIRAGRPENSCAAFRAAVEKGYGIEMDLQLSSDGAAMVFHDYTLDRVTEAAGLVRERPRDALCAIPFRGAPEEKIPDLPTVLNLIDGRVPVLIELKDQDGGMGPNVGALERATVAALDGYGGPAAVMSFNPESVACVHALRPELPVGLVSDAWNPDAWRLPAEICDRLREIPDFDRVGASFLSHDARDLDRPRVRELKRQGATILCWTTRSPEQDRAARKIAQNVTFEGYLPPVSA